MPEIKNNVVKRSAKSQWQMIVLRYYKVITALLVCLTIVASFFLILKPKYEQVGIGGRYNVDTLKTETERRQKYLADLRTLITNYQRISADDQAKLSQVLPHDKDIAGLFVQLEELAKDNDMQLAGVSINEVPDMTRVTNDAFVGKLNVTISLVGSVDGGYRQVKEFLADLELNMRIFDVNAVYFNPDSPHYTVSLFTYYYGTK